MTLISEQAPTPTSRGQRTTINLIDKVSRIDGLWQPRVIAEMNDYQFKVVKIEGDFLWHQHVDTDETFIVLEGELRIDFRDGSLSLRAGELAVVPKGVEHKPYAAAEVKLLLIEPRGVVNTGDTKNDRGTLCSRMAVRSRRDSSYWFRSSGGRSDMCENSARTATNVDRQRCPSGARCEKH
jgi:mannose-6-phosphate isomerase-like protein (cupin superfamily)